MFPRLQNWPEWKICNFIAPTLLLHYFNYCVTINSTIITISIIEFKISNITVNSTIIALSWFCAMLSKAVILGGVSQSVRLLEFVRSKFWQWIMGSENLIGPLQSWGTLHGSGTPPPPLKHLAENSFNHTILESPCPLVTKFSASYIVYVCTISMQYDALQ